MEEKANILIIDDNDGLNRSLKLVLEKKGYSVESASGGKEALAMARDRSFDIALMDIKLPDIEGTDLLCEFKKDMPAIEVIMITGYSSTEAVIKALNSGASAYLRKPLDIDEMLITMRRIFERTRLVGDKDKAEAKLKNSYTKLKNTIDSIMDTLGKIVEVRDPYTSGHQKKVARLAEAIARESGLNNGKVESIKMAALIHDVGKIGIPISILAKPGKLTDIELDMIRTHPRISYDLIKGIKFSGPPIAKMVLQHHERLDGSGYPNGLKDKDMLSGAKILAVADTVEAMSAHRPYRAALGTDRALEEINENKGKLYDPGAVDVCISLFKDKGFKF